MSPLLLLLLGLGSAAAMTSDGLTKDVPTREMHAEYDFVIVGAGPGGATLASRLTEVPEWSVLLLEAGGDELSFTDVPAFTFMLHHTRYNWAYVDEPQENVCLGLVNQRCICPRGKGMGGSSIINNMMYTRGHPDDYDNWERLGNPGWDWETALKYFKKSENAQGDFADSTFHSKGGYLDVQHIPFQTKISQAFLEASAEYGYPSIDYNADTLIGFSRIQATMRNGTRCSASKAFLRPVRDRANLHVAKNAHAAKVMLDADRIARGVEFLRGGKRWSVRAKKEVILAAGAINTPQILMLSGIGPREHLESMGVSVVLDAPGVGANLQDHVGVGGINFLIKDDELSPSNVLWNFNSIYYNYSQYGSGLFSIPGGPEVLGFVRTNISKRAENYPDVEFIFAPSHIATDYGYVVRRSLGVSDEVFYSVYRPIAHKRGFYAYPILLRPESSGKIELKNKNPLMPPRIFMNYYKSEHDINTMVEGIKILVDIVTKSEALKKFNTKVYDTPLPGCSSEFGTDEYWKCHARHLTITSYHQCCTAKMGPETDLMAVVDPELRVYGIQGLRVVDASIMPHVPAGHTMAPTYMIAEKAADIIKVEYGKM